MAFQYSFFGNKICIYKRSCFQYQLYLLPLERGQVYRGAFGGFQSSGRTFRASSANFPPNRRIHQPPRTERRRLGRHAPQGGAHEPRRTWGTTTTRKPGTDLAITAFPSRMHGTSATPA